VNVEAGTFSLRERHQELALEQLAFGQPIEVLDVAVYLFRNLAFSTTNVSTSGLITEFSVRFAMGSADNLRPLFRIPAADADLSDVFSRT
jgi:hypothetical protein